MRSKPSSSEREFFAALADVVFGNPFNPQRAALIVRLAPGAKPGDLTQDREALARLVGPRIAPWLGRSDLGTEERRMVEPALLYVCYHRHVPQIDALIERQARQGGAPLTVPFGEDAIGGSGAQRLRRAGRGPILRPVLPAAARVLLHPPLARGRVRVDAAPARVALEQRLHPRHARL